MLKVSPERGRERWKLRYLNLTLCTRKLQCSASCGREQALEDHASRPYLLFVVLPSTSVTGKHSTIPLRHVHLRCFSIARPFQASHWPILMYGQYVWLKAGPEHETQNLLTTYLLPPFFRQKPLRLNLGPVCIWLGKPTWRWH